MPPFPTIPLLHAAYADGRDPRTVVAEAYRRLAAVDDPGIFLALVFFKGLSWEFSAETISIVFVELCMFVVGRRIVHRVSHAMLVMSLYPLSLVLVAVLENVVKLN